MDSFYQRANEPSSSIKGRTILDEPSYYTISFSIRSLHRGVNLDTYCNVMQYYVTFVNVVYLFCFLLTTVSVFNTSGVVVAIVR
jgi:hypothetical protein